MIRVIVSLLFGCLLGVSARAQMGTTPLEVSVQYTPGATATAGAHGTTVPAMVTVCSSMIVSNFNAQGVLPSSSYTLYLVPQSLSSYISDSASMNQQFNWEATSQTALQKRLNAGDGHSYGASIGIVVSSPGAGVPGAIPINAPTSAKMAVGAVNADPSVFCQQLESAIAAAMGATKSKGIAVRKRLFPYENGYVPGGTLCYHTKDTDPSDPLTSWPFESYWTYWSGYPEHEIDSYLRAEAPGQVCQNMIARGGYAAAGDTTVAALAGSPPLWGCNFYKPAPPNPPGTVDGSAGAVIQITPTDSPATISCGSDILVTSYSHTGDYITVNGVQYSTGDASHNNVAAMNASTASVVSAYPYAIPGLLHRAQSAFMDVINAVLQ